MFTKLTILYAYDALRADGAAVRMARLGMFTTQINVIVALCWAMEITFAIAFCGKGACKVASILAFCFAYLSILALV